MNCTNHAERAAVAICTGCGAAICGGCRQVSSKGRSACSQKCIELVDTTDGALSMIAAKTLRSNKVTSWFSWIAGVAFIVSGIGFLSTLRPIAWFAIGLGSIFILAGFWYSRVAQRSTS